MGYKSSGVTMKKWYSLIDKIYDKDNLRIAFKSVKKNHGARNRWGRRLKPLLRARRECRVSSSSTQN